MSVSRYDMTKEDVTVKVKRAFSLMVNSLPVNCLNDTFIMSDEFCLGKASFKIMREQINDDFQVAIPYVKFENASIQDIVKIIHDKLGKELTKIMKEQDEGLKDGPH